jgi:hypothetical protein
MYRYGDQIVAMVCHQAIVGMQMAHELMRLQGDDAVPAGPFMYLHQDLLDAALDGVRRARRIGGSLSPRDHHDHWAEFLAARGWRQGPRDDVAKTHPNLTAWDDLSPEQQDKDRVFLSIVVSLTLAA